MSLARKHKHPVTGPDANKSHHCPFCSARFSRSDAARRHSTTCPQKRGRPIPSPLKRGRRRKACDFCAASKNGCDGEPGQCCSACLCRGQQCTYGRQTPGRRSEEQPDTAAASVTDAAPLTSPTVGGLDPLDPLPEGSSTQTPYKRIPISFLLQFTDPQNRSIQQHFPTTVKSPKENAGNVGNGNATEESSTTIDASYDGSHIYAPAYRTELFNQDSDPWAWPYDGIGMGMGTGIGEVGPFDSIHNGDFMFSRNWGVAAGGTQAALLSTEHPEHPVPELYDTLDATLPQNTRDAACPVMERRMNEILSALGQQSTAAAAAADPTLASARIIFDAARVDALLQAYFDCWHPHCPILHQPSFDATSAFLPLLVAMLMIGATYLSKESDEAARACLGVVETYIFEHAAFQRLLDPYPDENTEDDDRDKNEEEEEEKGNDKRKHMAPLQAAFAISILLKWHNHHGSKRRVRLHRYTDLVAAARNLGLPGLRHSMVDLQQMPRSLSGWKHFFHIEEAVRLMGYLFLVDSSHAIFHRMPPKLTLSEMTGSLPCSLRLFELPCDSPELASAWGLSFSTPKVASVSRAMSLFMNRGQGGQEAGHMKHKEKMVDDTDTLADDLRLFGHLDCQDLFILVSGLHEIIFTSSVSCSLEAVKPTLDHALARWKRLWDWHQGGEGDPDHKSYTRGGFYENAIEYFWLARLFLDNDGAPVTATEPHLRPAFDQDSMEEINAFMKKFAEIRLAE